MARMIGRARPQRFSLMASIQLTGDCGGRAQRGAACQLCSSSRTVRAGLRSRQFSIIRATDADVTSTVGFKARPPRLPHPAVGSRESEILKFEASLAKVLLGFVILEGSDDFLQQKTAVYDGLQTIDRYRPNHVLLICSAANGDPADTNLIRKQCRDRHFSRKTSQDADQGDMPPVLQAVIDCGNVPGPATSIT
jgi:hypothetical protein